MLEEQKERFRLMAISEASMVEIMRGKVDLSAKAAKDAEKKAEDREKQNIAIMEEKESLMEENRQLKVFRETILGFTRQVE